jgi:methyl-accepting chemotaxis protein/methyl-accepting chemotaxis protein-1 (serine sensor receptor)
MFVMGGMAMNSISSLHAELETATQKTARRLHLGGTMDAAGSEMLAQMRGIVVFSFSKDPARVQICAARFDASADSWQKALDEVRPLLVTEEGKRLAAQLQEQLTSWKSVIADVKQIAGRNEPDAALKIALEKGLPISEANTRDTTAFRDIQNKILEEQRAKGDSIYTTSRWGAFLLLGLTVAAGAILLVTIRSTSRTLRTSAAELSQASEQVASAAGQISSSSQSLAQGASEQAATVEETSASAQEIAAMTLKSAEDSRSAAELMTEASRVVDDANVTLEDMEKSMNEINSSSEKIAKIIKVIDEIAFQTNILALNAAVEAARAGEAGMGFAVVADEVRNLAQRSAQAAKDTAGMIEESITRSSEGRVKLDQVSQAIRKITEKSNAVKVLIDAVNVSSGEQAQGVEQISRAVTQVERVTQTSAASAEETASAGEELSAQSAVLRDLVHRLEELVGSQA